MYSKIKLLAGGLALIWGLFLAKGVLAAGTPASAAIKADSAISTVRLEKQTASRSSSQISRSSVKPQKTASSEVGNTAAKQVQSRAATVKSSSAAVSSPASAKNRESRQNAPVIKAKQARPSSQHQSKVAAANSSRLLVKKSR